MRKKFLKLNFLIISGIVLIGFMLRIWGIEWGLPEVYEEATPFYKAWNFWNWDAEGFDFNPHFFNYPSLYFYIQFMVQVLYYFFGLGTGLFANLSEFEKAFNNNPTTLILLSRLTTVLFGTTSIALVYLIGKKVFNETVGFVGGFFLAVSPLHIVNSQLISVDVPMTFFILLAFIFILSVYHSNKLKDYILAGVLIGLATGTKYPALLLVVSLFLAHTFKAREKKQNWKQILFDKRIITTGLIVILAFFCFFTLLLY